MKLTPQERLQITNLLGALQAGLSGAQGYSIFGNIESDIQARQARQKANQLNQMKLAMAQQQAQLAQQEQARQDALDLAKFQADQGQSQDALLQQLYAEASPKSSTHIQTDAAGNVIKQFTDQGVAVPYQQILGELAVRGPEVGLTRQQINAIGSGLDTAYTMPGISGSLEASLLRGRGLSKNNELDPFWQHLRNAVMTGMQNKVDPNQIKQGIFAVAAQQGYGSKDEIARANQIIDEMMSARGYPAPKGGGIDLTGALGGPPIVGDVTDAIGHALAPLVGLGVAAAGVAGKRKAYSKLGIKTLIPFRRTTPDQPAGADTPPEAAQTGEVASMPKTTDFVPPAEPSAGFGTGSIVDALAQAANRTTNFTAPMEPSAGLPTGSLADQMLANQVFEHPFSNQQIMGALRQGVSPMAVLGPEAPGLKSDVGGQLGAPAPEGGIGAGAMGALNSAVIPLQALDMWAQQRNAGNFYKEWAALPQSQKLQYVMDHRTMFPAAVTVSPNGNIVDSDGYVYDPMTGQKTTNAET